MIELMLLWSVWISLLMFGHWVGDFVCQTRWMADNKSKSWLALLAHVSIYTAIVTLIGVLFPLAYLGATFSNVITFFIVNFCLHFLTDAVTSRMTSYFWQVKNTKAFFTTIGFDQWLHCVCLIGTLTWMIFSGQ